MKYILSIMILLVIASSLKAQDEPTDFLKSSFHKGRRDLLRGKLPASSVAVFFANPVRNRANDVDFIYHQDPNFFYLSGYSEPHAVLMIFKEEQKDAEGNAYNEIIFVQPRNAMAEMWTGRRLGEEGTKEKLAIMQAYNNTTFQSYDIDFATFEKVLFYDFKNDVRDTREEADLYDLIAAFKTKAGYPDPNNPSLAVEPQKENLDTRTLDRYMRELRGVKTEEELVLLRKAVNISTIGQLEVMKALNPGLSEREIQGIHEFVFKKYEAEYEGYPSIVGAGHNGCILHYIENYKPEVDNDELILMDLGAEYHGYTADVTRTIPVSGKFSKEQKEIYDLVYEAQEAALQATKPGVTFQQLDQLARRIINQGLFELGVTDSANQRHMYYPHGLSHHIGLDVHDKGTRGALEANMVFTIEPGIYIPENSNCDEKWWKIAVRIEDDVLVTSEGFELLSNLAPRKSEEIEEVMKLPSPLDAFTLPDLDEGKD